MIKLLIIEYARERARARARASVSARANEPVPDPDQNPNPYHYHQISTYPKTTLVNTRQRILLHHPGHWATLHKSEAAAKHPYTTPIKASSNRIYLLRRYRWYVPTILVDNALRDLTQRVAHV